MTTAEKVNYWEIVKRSFKITIKYKFLWVFGLFVGITGGSVNIARYSSGSGNATSQTLSRSDIQQGLTDFLSAYWPLIMSIGLVVLILAIVFAVLAIISQGTLIGSVEKIELGEKIGIKQAWSEGVQYFWKIFALSLIFGLLSLAAIMVVLIPSILLLIFDHLLLGIMMIFLSILLVVPLVFIFTVVANYAFRFVVIKEQKIFISIKSGFALLKHKLGSSIIMTLIILLITTLASFAIMAVLLILLLPLLLMFGVAYAAAQAWGIAAVAVVGGVVVSLFFMALSAVLNTFVSACWTLFFMQITKPDALPPTR